MATVITGDSGISTVASGEGAVIIGVSPSPTHGTFTTPRQAQGFVGINGVNVWGDIKDYVTDIEYVDVACGETDSFDITVFDVDEHWLNDWLIDKGTLINAKIKLINWDEENSERWIDCGEFLCDSLEVEGFPITVAIKSLALPIQGTKNTKKWENISLSAIAKDICKCIGVELEYCADDITIKSVQQSRQTDIDFLFRQCSQYGFGMRVYRNKIIIFDRQAQDAADAVGTFNIKDAESFTLTDNEEGTYTGVLSQYKLENSDTVYDYTYGTPERQIVLEGTSSSLKEAELKAKAAIYEANSEMVKLKFNVMGGKPIYSNTNWNITGLASYSGKYAIDKVTHTVSSAKVYIQAVEAHLVK